MRRILALVSAAVLSLTPGGALADSEPGEPPLPEKGFFLGGEPGTCLRPETDPSTPETEFAAYGNACSRLKFAYGPIVVQPGDNDTGLTVKTIEKPWYDGYIVGFIPNLVRADGSVPNIEDIHLHHATWLSSPSYGNGPFFAAGEEKTIARFPIGYGMPVRRTDVWYFVNMVHNEGTQPELVWITYYIDYVAKAVGDGLAFTDLDGAPFTGIRAIKPFWLDVWKNGERASYPVYNTQRGYGQTITDPVTKAIVTKTDPVTFQSTQLTTKECTWPSDVCADHDSWSGVYVGQGLPGNGKGTDIYVQGPLRDPRGPDMSGTLIGIGGHVHPGGLRVEVDAVRCTEEEAIRPGGTITSWNGLACPDGPDADTIAGEQSARIFTSDATYFDRNPVSWNFSMTVTGIPRWKVLIEEGWFLRINSVYETDIASWYEGMGIAVAYVWKGTAPGALDPFTANVVDDLAAEECWAMVDADPVAHASTLCTRGMTTHGPLAEANNPGGERIFPWPGASKAGPLVDQIAIGGFTYQPGDLGTSALTGVPQVSRTAPLTWWNLDAAANIFHTVTGCASPCTGSTGIAYPIADLGYGQGLAPGGSGPVAFDSSELGVSPDFGPAKGSIPVEVGVPETGWLTPDWARNAVSYTIVPAEYGLAAGTIYTYFCRTHPFMRGAFKVIE